MGMADPAVAAVLQALTAPATPEQVSESYHLPDGSRWVLPVTITLTNQALARLVTLVTGDQFGYVAQKPEFESVPYAEPQAATPPPPDWLVEARKAEAAAVAEAWEGSPEAAAMRAEREAKRLDLATKQREEIDWDALEAEEAAIAGNDE